MSSGRGVQEEWGILRSGRDNVGGDSDATDSGSWFSLSGRPSTRSESYDLDVSGDHSGRRVWEGSGIMSRDGDHVHYGSALKSTGGSMGVGLDAPIRESLMILMLGWRGRIRGLLRIVIALIWRMRRGQSGRDW